MRIAGLALTLFAATALSPAAWAHPSDEVRAIYNQFAAAQNARDLQTVRSLLLDSPTFLWVSDGKSIWGREATLERMASFQAAEVWHVDPDLSQSVAVEVSDESAFLHLPLQLTIGSRVGPDKFRFLVSVLAAKTANGWRIAALFTTTEKPD